MNNTNQLETTQQNLIRILDLVTLIANGTIDKGTLNNVVAYKVKNIIRIDIKL